MPKQGFASIGVHVKIDQSELNYVTNLGDFGAEPNTLDTTCLLDRESHSVFGVQDNGAFPIDYLYDNSDVNSDFRVLRSKMDGQQHDLEITLPDGTVAKTKGEISTWQTAIAVKDLLKAKAVVARSQDWDYTDPE